MFLMLPQQNYGPVIHFPIEEIYISEKARGISKKSSHLSVKVILVPAAKRVPPRQTSSLPWVRFFASFVQNRLRENHTQSIRPITTQTGEYFCRKPSKTRATAVLEWTQSCTKRAKTFALLVRNVRRHLLSCTKRAKTFCCSCTKRAKTFALLYETREDICCSCTKGAKTFALLY